MAKFKVGDKVRVRSWESMVKQYGLNVSHSIATLGDSFVGSMRNYCGRVVTIDSIIEDIPGKGFSLYTVKGNTSGTKAIWQFSDAMFESKPINNTIVIYRKDNQVIALDKATGKTGIAYCSPEDAFDFSVGADLAFERLRDRAKPAKLAKEKDPEYYNGEVICTKTESPNLTVGKIYKVKNGKFVDDCGRIHGDGYPYVNFKDLTDQHWSEFVEVVR